MGERENAAIKIRAAAYTGRDTHTTGGPMTDPTADAIAALKDAASLADSEGFDERANYYLEVRSALLSAQGQAGTPVATDDIAAVRHGLQEAMVMADIANHHGDKPPFSSGYDDVHDAINAVWLAARAFERIVSIKGLET